MNNSIRRYLLLISIFIFLPIIFTNTAFAADNSTWKFRFPSYTPMASMDEVMPDKKFTITFSQDLNFSNFSKDYLDIYNSTMSKKIPLNFKVLSPSKIELTPVSPLNYGEIYYILIHKEVKNIYNTQMKTGIVCQVKVISKDHIAFIERIEKGAIEAYGKYKIFPSVTIAQAIIETGWGTSDKAIQCNNYFGVKASGSWNGQVLDLPTKEFLNGKYVDTTASWRVYPTVEDSILDHGVFLQKSNYTSKGVLSARNYAEQITAIHKGGYATDPLYSSKICTLINRLDLWKYDSNGVKLASFYQK